MKELLSLPLDAVNIDCDEELQTHYGMMAAERGLHISFDKPGSQPDAEFDALIDRVKTNGTVFHVSYMYRYNPAVMYAMEKIARGDIGEVISIEAQIALDPGAEDFAAHVRELTRGGVNCCVEVTGSGAALNQALDCMARFGRVSLLSCTRISDFTVDFYRKVHYPGIHLIDMVSEVHSPAECGETYTRLYIDKNYPLCIQFDWSRLGK